MPPDRLAALLLLHLEGDPLHGEGECSGRTTRRVHRRFNAIIFNKLRGLFRNRDLIDFIQDDETRRKNKSRSCPADVFMLSAALLLFFF